MWNGKRVVVTGAGGFIGSHLCEELVRRGARVRGFVRYTSSGSTGCLALLAPTLRREVEVVAGDIRDATALRTAIDGADVVFHLAAVISIPYSYAGARDVVDVNVGGTLNVLEAALSGRVGRLVVTSTSEVYGSAQQIPITEAHPLVGQSPYSASKIGADALTESFHRAHGLPTTVVRPFNTYGPRQSGRAVIPTLVAQALWAPRVKLGALTPTRDFLFVDDTVRGFLALAESRSALGRVVHLGTGVETSIAHLADVVFDVVGRAPPVDHEDARDRPAKSEVLRLLCDPSQAAEIAGWRSTVTLREGVAAVAAFLQQFPDWVDARRYAT
jgi:dTDP-glucose 4,6-dehydratase